MPFVLIVIVGYFNYQIKLKSTVSNAIRIEQMHALLSGNWFVGNGLGSSVNYIGEFRTYTGENIYFELQSLYIFYQIGIVGMILFFTSLLFQFNHKRKECLIVFLIYLAYSFWNPYCFDTTEMMAVALTLNINFNSKISYVLDRLFKKED